MDVLLLSLIWCCEFKHTQEEKKNANTGTSTNVICFQSTAIAV